MAGSNDLQAAIDRLDQTMVGMTTAIQGMNNGNGTWTSPASSPSLAAAGATFTNGNYGGAGGNGGSTNASSGFGSSGGAYGTNPFTATSVTSGLISSAINGVFQMGAKQLNDQAQINTYGYTQAGFWNVSAQSATNVAFGGQGSAGLFNNNMALNATDARTGASMLSQISGQANYTAAQSGPYGRGNAPFQAAAGIALSNPGLGATGSASVSGAWYNAGTSYNLMMMGVANTPLQMGTGKAQSMTGVEASIGQRFGFQGYNAKQGTFNSSNLAANLNNPLFQMQIMQATGMTQDQYNQWSQSWAQENTWASKSGTSMSTKQSEISNYMNGSSGQQAAATKALQSQGVSMSMLQSMTQSQAGQTATESASSAGFVSGLQSATTAINALTNVMSKALEGGAGAAGGAAALGSLYASDVSGAGGSGSAFTTAAAAVIGGLGTLSSDFTKLLNAGGSSSSSGSTTAVGGNPASKSSEAANQALGKEMAASWGWSTGTAWTALNNLEMAEAGWNNTAQNPTSTAYGIGQFLDSTWATVGAKKTSDPSQQISAMYNYIYDKYKTPEAAWQHEQQYNWYSDGTGSARSGLAVVGERGPEVVALSGGQQILSAAKTAQMMQPSFGGGSMSGGGGTAGVTVVFEAGSVTLGSVGGNTGASGYHTSADVQAQAQQFIQAVETGLQKSQALKNIKSGSSGS